MRNKVVETLKALERKGRLTPVQVVEEARAEDSPIHSYFTWDDGKAAEAYRLDQARTLIARVRVVNENTDKGEVQRVTITRGTSEVGTPLYVPDARNGSGYVAMERLKREPETAKAVLAAEFAAAAAYLKRAENIAAEIRGFKEPTERVRREVVRLQDKAKADVSVFAREQGQELDA